VNVVDEWFRGSVSGEMRDYLLGREARIFDYLNPEAVEQMYGDHVSGRRDNHKILFSLVVFEQWLRATGAPRQVACEAAAPVPG
jgi:asparagine synthase (glutamine-hydrolysing)